MLRKHFLFLCCLLISSLSHSQNWTIELDKALRQLDRESLFDGQVLIAEAGTIKYVTSFGETMTGKNIKDETPLKVYSVGKSFTALAILQLMEAGKLSLEDPITKYFPGLPYTGVTIDHLLHMTSGLPRILALALNEADTSQILSNKGLIQLIQEQQPNAAPPGQSFSYNNTNYYLLASIVEQVSGQAFDAYLTERIFQVCGMLNSYESIPRIFNQLQAQGINADNFLQASGAGSVFTTAYDLYLYDQALYGEQLLTEASKKIFFGLPDLPEGNYSNYACGWRVENSEQGTVYYHVGDGTAMRASIQRFVDEQKTLIYLHTNSNIYHQQVYNVVRNIWEGKPYELPKLRQVYAIDPALFPKYIGAYESQFGIVHISTENGKLFLRPDPIPGKEELIPASDTTFYFKDQNLEWEFFLDEQGAVIGFGIKGDRENMGTPKK